MMRSQRHLILSILTCIAILMVSLITHPSSFATNVRVTARANVGSSVGFIDDRTYENPIQVFIDFVGGTAANPLRYGNLKITSATSNLGSLEIIDMGQEIPESDSNFQLIDNFSFLLERIANGIRLELEFFNENNPTRIQKLQGSIDFQTIDTDRIVTVNNLSDNFPLTVNHPKLKNLGSFSIKKYTDYSTPEYQLEVVGEGSKVPDFSARFIEGNGNIINPSSFGTATINDIFSRSIGFFLTDESLRNASIEIFLGFNTTTVPFNLSNIPIGNGE